MTAYNFKDRDTVERLKKIAKRDKSNPTEFNAFSVERLRSLSGLIYFQLPDDVPAKSPGGPPGMVSDCIPLSIEDDGTEVQLLDEDGDVLTVDAYHFGPSTIEALTDNGDPNYVFADWHDGRWVIIVEYCPPDDSSS